ncbi:MAG: hypothetical protein LKF41_02770 [Bifidobacterium sp.]|jgi:hypothetical protein|nr:hypothetical protein [Bifidobacterium sp.]MCH4174767.1 hypothetical protein [Bifidobacterium sp.]
MSGKDVQESADRVSGTAKGVVAVQLAAYVVLVVSAGLLSLWSSTAVVLIWIVLAAVGLLGVMLYWWPFDDTATTSLVERAVSGVTGICAFVAAAYTAPRVADMPEGSTAKTSLTSWAIVFGILITVLVVVGFITQMMRRVRSHLITSLSHAVFGGIACVSAAGWSFLPVMIAIAKSAQGLKHIVGIVLVILVVLVILLSMGAAATSWWREDNRGDSRTRVGIAMLPVMICGIAIYMATLACYFLVF